MKYKIIQIIEQQQMKHRKNLTMQEIEEITQDMIKKCEIEIQLLDHWKLTQEEKQLQVLSQVEEVVEELLNDR